MPADKQRPARRSFFPSTSDSEIFAWYGVCEDKMNDIWLISTELYIKLAFMNKTNKLILSNTKTVNVNGVL